DDQLGELCGALAGQADLTAAIPDLLGSGALTWFVEITSDDPALRDDPTVGVRFIDGDSTAEMGALLVGGALSSNPDALTHDPASATLHLPLFRHADPLTLPAIGLEITLRADGSGFAGELHGAFPADSDVPPTYAGLTQMIAANPQEFPFLWRILDTDHDGAISFDEFADNDFIQTLMAPDVQLTDGHGDWAPHRNKTQRDSLSFALEIHLSPCPSGDCRTPPADSCQDRVLDGDETDVDCGGSCLPCPGAARCTVATDCQSQQCASGACAPPSCSDGVQDGAETSVDCGDGCPPCA
ncbi:MAG TPA: hypothetical protein VGL86_25180, partial [Polyangia bacterium]